MVPAMKQLGFCTHLQRRGEGWKVEHLLPLLKEMGASFIREDFEWGSTERAAGRLELTADQSDILDRLAKAEIAMLPALCYGNPIHGEKHLDPDLFCRYVEFMVRSLREHGVKVVAWEIWNEPTNFAFRQTYGGSWSGQEPCLWGEKFCQLTRKAAALLKDLDPVTPVLVSPGEPQIVHLMRRYPEAFAHVDAIGIHPYPSRFPPETVTWGGEQLAQRDGVSVADDDHSFFSLCRMMRQYGRECLGRDMGLYITEWGYSTHDHSHRSGNLAGYTEEAQAMYLSRGLILALAAGLDAFAIYDFMDDGLDRYEQEHHLGVVRHERLRFEPKPSWHALRSVVQTLGGALVVEAPMRLVCEIKPLSRNDDKWQWPVEEPFLRINEPQMFCFKRPDAHVCFVWRGGRHSGEYNAPVGQVEWDHAPAFRQILITDMVGGRSLPVRAETHEGRLVLHDVPVGGSPVAIVFET